MADERKNIEEAVKNCYSTWSDNYYRDYYQSESAYPAVHTNLVRQLLVETQANNVLDAGCGPASMLRDLDILKEHRYGFDLTPQMVSEAKTIMREQGVPESHIWQGSVLDPAAFKDPAGEVEQFDAAISIGVLPHIPEEQDTTVLANMIAAVAPGGLVVLEARNALFALFTMNRYSNEFIRSELIRDQKLLQAAGTEADALHDALASLNSHFRMDLPPVRKGKEDEPGYDEVLSRTHNPFVLKEQAEQAGLKEVRLLFYHYHCLPPMLEQAVPDLFRRESIRMEDPYDWRGHFMASAFLVAGKK